MQLDRQRKSSDAAMTGEAPGPSGHWIQQGAASLVPNTGKIMNNNVSVQTGEEFSMEFLQDRVAARGIQPAPIIGQNNELRIGQNYNQNHPQGCGDLARILGFSREDSECASGVSGLSAKGPAKEIENGVYSDKLNKYHKEDGDNGHGARRAFGELNGNQVAGVGPISPPTFVLESSRGNNFNGPGVPDESPAGKMKFLCSFGGKILPRPSDSKLRYVGGETKIISLRTNLSWEELVKKTLGICNQPHSIKYQLPGEDLDALISVSSDEDLQNMIEEYRGIERLEGSQRLRLFLIPLSESEKLSSLEASTILHNSSDYQYVVAVNGILEPSTRKNSGGQSLANETSQLGTDLDRNPSFHKHSPAAPLPLEINGGFGDSYLTQFINEPQPPNQSSPIYLVPLQSGDSKSVPMQLQGNNSSVDSSSSFITAQLQPEDTSTDTGSGRYPSFEPATLVSYHHAYKQMDANQPDQIQGVQLPNHNSKKGFANPSTLDPNDNDLNGFSYEKPVPKERTFHSEKPVSRPGNPIGLLSGSIDFTDPHQGMSHAYSDSKLNAYGGGSAYCSLEGMSPSSPLNFAKIQLPSLPVSNVLQEKPMQRYESTDLLHPKVQNNLLDIGSTGSQIDVLQCFPLESACRKKPISKLTNDTRDKRQTTNDAVNNDFTKSNHFDENSSTLETRKMVDERDLFLHQGGNFFKGRPPANSLEHMNNFPNDDCHQTNASGVDTFSWEMQLSGGMHPTSSAIGPKPFVNIVRQHTTNFELDKPLSDHIVVDQTAKDQHCDLTGAMIGQGSNAPCTENSEVAGLFPKIRLASSDGGPLADPVPELSSGLVFREQRQLQPAVFQNSTGLGEPDLKVSADLSPSPVHYDAGPSSHLHNSDLHTVLQKPTIDVSLKREVSPIDGDFIYYPDQKVEKLRFEEYVSKKSNVADVTLIQTNPAIDNEDRKRLESVVLVEDVTDSVLSSFQSLPAVDPHVADAPGSGIVSPNATESDSPIPGSESEDSKADYRDKNESLTDAMIAEMEASIYGLQIIRNVDLEELRELGSGTYGTVYHGKWRGTDVAIKRIKKNCFAGRSSEQERLTKDFWREAQILSNLHHPNVVAFYGVVPDGTGGTLATVTEFMVNGSLRHVLLKKDRSLDRRKKLIVAMDAAFGMEYLHSKNIVHFDLKCDNLLVNLRDPQRPICKVGDFGLSRIKRNTLVSGGVRGTLPWMAPELLNGSSSRVSEKVDVFSFGISMWEILTGEEPYADMHCGAIIGGILKNTLRPTIPERCDPEWRKLMEDCWSPDPEARPSFTEITNRLRSMSMALQAKGQNSQSRQTKPNVS
ncbi:hypothetical protein Pint_01589 [Pistacia integerrima]|uniref:Uncharacterized protein n=1 Tax=Pistacia integerrima TaxID=434235 RepID=A0ACC0ZMF9_9ROSI|nr:hypothetical protein Pint_01589 [Pistacia integerrima]